MTKQEFLSMNDHSLLKPHLTKKEIMEGLQYAKDNHCASVCINPCNLDIAREVLEAIDAYARGAVELDMVIDIGALRNGEYDDVYNDIKAVVDATPAVVKVILENCYLTKEQIVKGCQLCEKAGADFVKTSTGFAEGGATVEDIKLMRESVSEKVHVKAAGGIHSKEDVEALVAAGADRVGVSRTQAIAAEF